MTIPTPEDRAKLFAARWFKCESPALRELGQKEIAAIIQAAIEAERQQAADAPDSRTAGGTRQFR